LKACFYGNTGHFFTAFLAKERIPELLFSGYCKSFPEESMGQLKLFAGEVEEGGRIALKEHQSLEAMIIEGAYNAGRKDRELSPLKEYGSLESMLDTEKPDILVVDNRIGERYQSEKFALQKGVNVYADKPIAVKENELEDLYTCVNESGKILWAMNTVRYNPWYYTAKKLVVNGAVGKVRMVNCQKSYRWGKRPDFYRERKYYGGTFGWVTIHAIDMIRMVTGKEFLSVYSQSSRADNFGYGDMEVITTSCFEMEDNILATISTDYYRPENTHSHDDDRMRVVGTQGIVEVIRRDGDHEVRLLNKDNNGEVPVPQEESPLIFEDFVHTLHGKGTGLHDVDESFRNAYAAICAQRSADEKNVVRMKNARVLFPRKGYKQ
jgi:predicted dehydrogenase